MAFFEFPHTRTYDSDLGWLIKAFKEISEKLDTYLENAVIKFADPITWDITEQYTALTCVIDSDGTAYLSKQPVPAGVDISNTDYWLPIFNYDDNINELRSQIAYNARNSNTTGVALSAGDLVFWNSLIYKVTADMPAGTAFVIGSNVIQYTVNDRINDVSDKVDDEISQLRTEVTGTIDDFEANVNSQLDGIRDDLDGDIAAIRDEIAADIAEIKAHAPVNVKDYGAVGDGVNDDTAAFQAALDTGYDVFVPLSRHEHYIISGTLYQKSHLQAMFGDAERRQYDLGWIGQAHNGFIDFTGTGSFLSNNNYTGFYAHHLTIDGGESESSSRTKVCFNLDGGNIGLHIDSKIEECALTGFHWIVNNNGRGTYLINSYCSYFDTAYYHKYQLTDGDGRGVYICGNKFHNGVRILQLSEDTHLSYAVIRDNFSDSTAYLLEDGTNSTFDHVLISNNTFNLMSAYQWIKLDTTVRVRDCIISDNIVRSASLTDRMFLTNTVLNEFTNNIFSNNIFENCTGDCIFIQGVMTGCVFTGNAFVNVCSTGNDGYAAIRCNRNVNDCIISNNYVNSPINSAVFKMTAAVSGTQIINNTVSGTIVASIGSSGAKSNNIQANYT